MFEPNAAFSGFSVDDIDKAKEFYSQTLGFECTDQMGGFSILLPNSAQAWVYAKQDHEAASYTALNFMVDDIQASLDLLVGSGVVFEKYEGMHQDENGIAWGKEANMGPNIAWFKDPAGNILGLIEN